jgi:hypothetical protein
LDGTPTIFGKGSNVPHAPDLTVDLSAEYDMLGIIIVQAGRCLDADEKRIRIKTGLEAVTAQTRKKQRHRDLLREGSPEEFAQMQVAVNAADAKMQTPCRASYAAANDASLFCERPGPCPCSPQCPLDRRDRETGTQGTSESTPVRRAATSPQERQ